MSLKISSLKIDNPFFLAPMEAVNCASFRVLCLRRGAGLVYTDMIDADIFAEFAKENSLAEAIHKFINPQEEEKGKLAIQLGGRDVENLIFTINAVKKYAVLIDFNVGCPLGYMLGKKGGVYLMKHPEQLYSIVKLLRTEIDIPFTVKIRSGWDNDSINAIEISKELEILGVDAITIHPRTRKQKYSDKADWQLVRKIKDSIKIPVILSGDVTNTYMAKMAFDHTKCDAIMIGRAGKNNPSIFTKLNKGFADKKPIKTYDKNKIDSLNDFKEFLELYKKMEYRFKLSEIKDHALWLSRECKNNKQVTQKIIEADNEDQILKTFEQLEFN